MCCRPSDWDCNNTNVPHAAQVPTSDSGWQSSRFAGRQGGGGSTSPGSPGTLGNPTQIFPTGSETGYVLCPPGVANFVMLYCASWLGSNLHLCAERLWKCFSTAQETPSQPPQLSKCLLPKTPMCSVMLSVWRTDCLAHWLSLKCFCPLSGVATTAPSICRAY